MEDLLEGPVAGTRNGRPSLLVPTAAAVIRWDAAGQAADMQAPPVPGKPDVPRLFQWTTPSVVDSCNGSISHDDLPIDASTIPAYFQRAMTEQSRDGLIRLRLQDHVVSADAASGSSLPSRSSREASEGWPIVEADDSFQLLAGIVYGTRGILVGPHHLIEINMERVARAVYSGQSPPQVQRRSDKK